MNELTHLDLFSGIGGFALAAKWNGYRTLAFCDNEPYAQAVLKKHWPDVPCHQDIREVRGELYAGVTLLTGGFPCQPFSVAGKQRGKDDNRYLWPEMLRVIREAKPTWIIGENVAGIVNLALDQVCTDLEAEGYEVEPIIIPACAVDAPHRRDRVWIVGYAKSNGLTTSKAGRGLFNQPEEQGGQEQEREFAGTSCASADVANADGRQRIKCESQGQQIQMFGESGQRVCDDVANAIGHAERSAHGEAAGGGQRGREEQSECQRNQVGGNPANSSADVSDTIIEGRQGRVQGGESERRENIQGHSGCGRSVREQSEQATWLPEPNVGRVAHGIPNRVHRLKGLGNAIVPQVASEIIRCINKIMEDNK